MNEINEKTLSDLEAKTNRTPEEETLRVALLELDEKSEDKDAADKALADAIANNPTPTPDPIVTAQVAQAAAVAAEDTAQKAVDVAFKALPVVAELLVK